jgi:hypothetical protein
MHSATASGPVFSGHAPDKPGLSHPWIRYPFRSHNGVYAEGSRHGLLRSPCFPPESE